MWHLKASLQGWLLHVIRPLSTLLTARDLNCGSSYLCHMSLCRKIYWTDGNTINMANMDGSNSKVLHQNQRDPAGQSTSSGCRTPHSLHFRCDTANIRYFSVVLAAENDICFHPHVVKAYCKLFDSFTWNLQSLYLLRRDMSLQCQPGSQTTPTIAALMLSLQAILNKVTCLLGQRHLTVWPGSGRREHLETNMHFQNS